MVDLTKLKICFIAGCLGQGGAERQLYYILRSLRDLGVEPKLLSLTNGEYWEEKIRQLGVPVVWVGRRQSRLARLASVVAGARKYRPDIIQSQHFFANLYAVGAARILRTRGIGAIRSDAVSEVQTNGRLLGRLSINAPQLLVANSRRGINNAIDLRTPASRLTYLPNVVDTDAFRSSPDSQKDHDCVRLLLVGNLKKVKRVDVFLEVVARLQKALPGIIKAVIVGDGPLRAALERRAAELGLLPERVVFRGAVSDVAAEYHQADILVLTSDWEGTPNVLLEAMACGLPVVATRVGGVPEVVQEGVTGFLAEPGDIDTLVDRLTRLCRCPQLRAECGRKARQHVLANHSFARLSACLQSLYEAVLS